MAKFAGVELTQESIIAARQWFHDNALACISEVESGAVKVNDPAEYFAWRKQQAADSLAGKNDHTFALLQKAHYIQTGECIAFLP